MFRFVIVSAVASLALMLGPGTSQAQPWRWNDDYWEDYRDRLRDQRERERERYEDWLEDQREAREDYRDWLEDRRDRMRDRGWYNPGFANPGYYSPGPSYYGNPARGYPMATPAWRYRGYDSYQPGGIFLRGPRGRGFSVRW
jgi:hypothetical protein